MTHILTEAHGPFLLQGPMAQFSSKELERNPDFLVNAVEKKRIKAVQAATLFYGHSWRKAA